MAGVYDEYAPGAALNSLVECFWSFTTEEPVPEHLVAPDGCANLVFCAGGNIEAAGAMTRSRKYSLSPATRIVGVRFRPGGASLFTGFNARELTDSVLPLDALWGSAAAELNDRLNNATSVDECLRVISTVLRRRAARAQDQSSFRKALEVIIAAMGEVDLDAMASQANLSNRQFRRRCVQETGLTPKLLCRILRFRRALSCMTHRYRHGYASLALDCGYFDQAHLIRSFREFTGFTPARSAASTLIWPYLNGIPRAGISRPARSPFAST